jgi:hypothetical protein
MIWPGCGIPCTVLMVSNNLSGIAYSQEMDGMDKLLRIYILKNVGLSSLYLLATQKNGLFGSFICRYFSGKQEVIGNSLRQQYQYLACRSVRAPRVATR